MKTSCLILSLWTSNLMFPLELRHQNRLTPGIQTVRLYILQIIQTILPLFMRHHIFLYFKERYRYLCFSTALKKAIQQIAKINQYYFDYPIRRSAIFSIAQSKILYLERIMRTTNIHTADTIYQTPEKMDSLLERLCPWFCPSHRSYIVNGRHIVNLRSSPCYLIKRYFCSSQQNLLRKFKKTFARCIWADGMYFTNEEAKGEL